MKKEKILKKTVDNPPVTCYYITRPQREESVKTVASDKEAHMSDARLRAYDLPGNRTVRQGFEKS